MARQAHPSFNELAEFAMGVGSETETVRRHLTEGCGTCLHAVNRLRELSDAEPADASEADWIRPGRLPVSTFGRRDDSRHDLHYVVRLGGYELDVLVRRQPHTGELVVAGQVTYCRPTYDPATNLEIALVDESGRKVTHTMSDEFGEFDFEVGMHGRYALRVGATCILIWDGHRVTA